VNAASVIRITEVKTRLVGEHIIDPPALDPETLTPVL
jgi:hypothetical protein